MAISFKKDQSQIRSFNRYWYVINGEDVCNEEYVTLFIDM